MRFIFQLPEIARDEVDESAFLILAAADIKQRKSSSDRNSHSNRNRRIGSEKYRRRKYLIWLRAATSDLSLEILSVATAAIAEPAPKLQHFLEREKMRDESLRERDNVMKLYIYREEEGVNLREGE